jgi:bifunctional DNA-binding transcriptional regulator/antitoxin component of YhaV-PrlF toxin-antitoxin module
MACLDRLIHHGERIGYGGVVEASRVSRKSLTTVPARVRRALGIEEGDTLLWEVDEEYGRAVVRVAKNPLRPLRGKYNDPNLSYSRVEGEANRVLVRMLGDARAGGGREDYFEEYDYGDVSGQAH